MKNKNLINILLLFCFLIFQTACIKKHKNVDKFYVEKGDGDLGRIPLLKPYEAVIVTKDYGWCVNLKGKYTGIGFCNIKKVTVLDTVILLSTGNTILDGLEVKQSWHIIIPRKDFEKGFDRHQDYLNYLKKIGIIAEPRLYDIDTIANYFDNNDFIDWKAITK